MALWEGFEAQDESFTGFSTNPFDIDNTDQVRSARANALLMPERVGRARATCLQPSRVWDMRTRHVSPGI